MIEITRSLARELRAVFRRSAWAGCGRGSLPPVLFQAGPDGLRVRTQLGGVAVEYLGPGNSSQESACLPGRALQAVEGQRGSAVRLEAAAEGRVLARWDDRGVPQAVEFEATSAEDLPPFLGLPDAFTPVGSDFLRALDDAARAASRGDLRYALSMLQLRGNGSVVATDGRQLLVQAGFPFPWTEDLLVPRVCCFGCPEFRREAEVSVGRAGGHVAVRAGPWTFALAIDSQARFPKAEQVIPRVTGDVARLLLAEEDAALLGRSLAVLPGNGGEHAPVTLDLGRPASVRARAEGQDYAVELVLERSEATGPPTLVCVNRGYLVRALALGFREFHFAGPEAPGLCRDGTRQYVWMTLGKGGVVPAGPGDVRVYSATEGEPVKETVCASQPTPDVARPTQLAGGQEVRESRRQRRIQPVNQNLSNGHAAENGNGHPVNKEACADPLMEEAQAVQGLLRDALGRLARLQAAVRQERRQRKLVRATLASLRQLQQIGK
jgi:hypothetical protein